MLAPALMLTAALAAGHRTAGPPAGDLALLEVAVRAAASGDLAVGPYSRFGFRHPGPAVPLLLVPGYRLAGGGARGMALGATLANLLWLVLALAALRAGSTTGERLVLTAALAQLVAWMGPALASPWNPHMALLPFALTVLAAGAASSSPRWLAAAFLAGSAAVQAHLATAPGVAAVLAVGTGAAVRATVRTGAASASLRRWSWVPLACCAAALAWLPVLLAGPEPWGRWNLGEVFRTLRGHSWVRPLPESVRLWSLVAVQPLWLGDPPPWPVAGVLAAAVCLAGVASLPALRNRVARFRLAACLAALAAGPAAASRLIGPPEGYLLQWTSVPVVFTAALALAAAAGLVAPTARRPVRAAARGFLALVLAGPTAMGVGLLSSGLPLPEARDDVEVLSRAAAEAIRHGLPRPVALRSVGGRAWEAWAGVLDRLHRDGLGVVVQRDRWHQVPRRLLAPAPPASALVLLPIPEAVNRPWGAPANVLARGRGVALAAVDLRTPRRGTLPAWAAPLWAARWSGLGRVEGLEADPFRWSEGPTVRLEIPVRPGAYSLAVQALAYPAGRPQEVTVRHRGRPVARFVPAADRRWRWYPAGTVRTEGPLLDLELDLLWTTHRRDAERSGDLARIGLALRTIHLEPVPPEAGGAAPPVAGGRAAAGSARTPAPAAGR